MIKEIIFNGEVGTLEGKYYQSKKKFAPAALVLHPHPTHAGSMDNEVVCRVFDTFKKNNFSVLRFNFKGVGKSSGSFGDGKSGLIDAGAAMNWLELENPQASCHWIAGYSFGACIAMQLLMRRPEIDRFLSVSPSAAFHGFKFTSPCPIPGLIAQGGDDDVAKEADTYTLYKKMSKRGVNPIDYKIIDGADHDFVNHLEDLIATIDDYIKPRMSRPVQERDPE